MARIGRAIVALLVLLFPVIGLRKTNHILDKRIDDLEKGSKKFSYMAGYESLNVADAEGFLNKTLEVRKAIEDKAKVNVLGVTISVSLIIGLSQMFHNHDLFLDPPSMKFLSVLLAFYSLSSMLIATVLSVHILGVINRAYDLYPPDKTLALDAEKLNAIAASAELNMNYNIKRNNYLYLSYRHIINSLIGLFFMFLIVVSNGGDGSNVSLQKLEKAQTNIREMVDGICQSQRVEGDILSNVEKKIQSSERTIAAHSEKIKTLEQAIQQEHVRTQRKN